MLGELNMKRLMTAVCCACVLGVGGVEAAQMNKADHGKMDKKSMAVTGCVAEQNGHYMLNDAMMSGSTKDDMKPMSYDLMGGDLKAHVGHKVEVMGSVSKKSKDKTGMSDMNETLRIKSVKMISTTCP